MPNLFRHPICLVSEVMFAQQVRFRNKFGMTGNINESRLKAAFSFSLEFFVIASDSVAIP